MTTTRITQWLLACGLALLPMSAGAQVVQPFGPVPFIEEEGGQPTFIGKTHNLQPFAPYDPTQYGPHHKPREGFFFTWDGLNWSVSSPERTDIGRDGLIVPVYVGERMNFRTDENTLTTGVLDAEFHGGHRLEGGYMYEGHGWLANVWELQAHDQRIVGSDVIVNFVDPPQGMGGLGLLDGFVDLFPLNIGDTSLGDGFDDDIDKDGVFGRFGIDVGVVDPTTGDILDPDPDGIPDGLFRPEAAAIDFDDAVRFPVVFEDLVAEQETEAWGVELMKLWRRPERHLGGQFEFGLGGRFMYFEDEFNVQAFGGVLDTSHWNTESENNIIGPQIMARWSREQGRWKISAEGRYVPALNLQHIRQESGVASNFDVFYIQEIDTGAAPLVPPQIGPRINAPALLGPHSSNDALKTEEFTNIVEFRMQAEFQLTQAISLGGGYNFIWMNNIARASNMVDYTLPRMGVLRGGEHNRQDVFMSGPFIRLNINR